MAGDLLLVGSIPLDTPEQVFRRVGGPLGPYLAYMPDGEVGDRRYWIDGIAYRVFNGHPEIEALRRPAPRCERRRELAAVGRARPVPVPRQAGRHTGAVRRSGLAARLHEGRGQLAFCVPSAAEGRRHPAEYAVSGLPAADLQRHRPVLPDPADPAKVAPGVTATFRAEIAKMLDLIPPEELAIQWDLAVENRLVDTALAREGPAAAEALAARLAAPAAEIAPAIPERVALGYHGCFGTLSGWPSRQPPDLGGSVILLNAMVAASGRRVDFLHLPTLGTADEAFFAPLDRLRAPDAKIYLGAIHHMHDADGLRRQLQTARRHLAEFGLAAPCGFGRAPERPGRLLTAEGSAPPPDILDIIVRDHLNAVELLHEARR